MALESVLLRSEVKLTPSVTSLGVTGVWDLHKMNGFMITSNGEDNGFRILI